MELKIDHMKIFGGYFTLCTLPQELSANILYKRSSIVCFHKSTESTLGVNSIACLLVLI